MLARAAVLTEFNTPFALTSIDLGSPSPGQVLVRTLAAPFCSTDWMGWRAMRGKRPPVVLGHTAVGEVEALGAGVTDLAIGDRVLVAGTPQCRECFYCRQGRPDQCSVLMEQGDPVVGAMPDGTEVRAAGRVGAYASRLRVDRIQLHPLPADLPAAEASLLGCGISTAFGAVFRIAEVATGQAVAVLGLGHLGLWAVQAARLAGAGEVIGIDPHPERRRLALELGADAVVDPSGDDAVDTVRARTAGRGADAVIEAAGSATATREAVLMTRRAGTAVLTGVAHADTEVSIPQLHLTVLGKRVLGCQNGQLVLDRDMPEWIALLAAGRIDASRILTGRYRLDEIDGVARRSQSLDDLSGVFVDFSSDPG
ncbi:zinc-binding dehydrogenase [Leucobacter allii]|uniref:Zinc-binding dehydrogenase n=1 Tax=Leucobacter allii TaxID=2932247 RepID=A0ABY4FKU3_9MICO|nr:zinc-binding dehydrogenase [Leucobacter allii]UOQ56898.1 zinc-binding dehydrogenase [Leucobacter allii]